MMDIQPDATGSTVVSKMIWDLADLPANSLSRLELTGDRPLLPTSFHVGIAAQSTIACAALAAAEIGLYRSGHAQDVSVDMHAAEMECTGYFTIDGKVPNAWAPLSGLYPCRDGHVRVHANFDHHRDGTLRILGIAGDPASVRRHEVEAALQGWKAIDFESAAAAAGMVVSAVRSFKEWDQTKHAEAARNQPLFTMQKIGDASPIQWNSISRDEQPLQGIRILDLTRILAGPVCGRTLAAYGADVMLVNSPDLPNIESIAETSRGKMSTLLDLKSASDASKLIDLVRDANVFVQGYRPDGLRALGFSSEQLAAIRPGIVCVSLSAYGNDGPWADRRGFDSLVQTATGFNDAEARAAGVEAPKAMPVQILDYASGFLMAFAAQAALVKQSTEGGSWHVQVSLIQTAQWLRGLGRVNDNFHSKKPDFRSASETYPSGFGTLTAIPHAARFANFSASWKRPSVPPGTHQPNWP
jgi:crotonobetainyl-CoA:carnitine CoA-transferase CaiB-like acyl-CoA transferase